MTYTEQQRILGQWDKAVDFGSPISSWTLEMLQEKTMKLETLTDDELRDLHIGLENEKSRRKGEKKLPVYRVGHKTMKSLPTALHEVIAHCNEALNFPRGPEVYFSESLVHGAVLTALEVEMWNESEYNARPNIVWG